MHVPNHIHTRHLVYTSGSLVSSHTRTHTGRATDRNMHAPQLSSTHLHALEVGVPQVPSAKRNEHPSSALTAHAVSVEEGGFFYGSSSSSSSRVVVVVVVE